MAKPTYFYGIHAIDALLNTVLLMDWAYLYSKGARLTVMYSLLWRKHVIMASVFNQRKKTNLLSCVVARNIKA